jgi:ATP-dependent DNA helicase HFM1/MER3
MANNFLSSIDRISSFAYHGEPRICHSRIPEEIVDQPDIPLDAFDKELLAACPPTLSDSAEYGPSLLDSEARMSLPPRNTHALSTTIEAARTLRDGPYTPLLQSRRSSSASTAAASSPTVVALQNRQSFHSSSSNAVQKPRLGENMSYTDHAESVMASMLDNRQQSNQRQGELPQQSHGVKAHRTYGPITRMGLGHAPPIVKSMPLIAATELPDRYRSIFPFPVFNVVQSKCFSTAFGSNDNLVVSAPTGSGKTAIMELAICHLLHTSNAGDFKVVYQAPTKSLCSERMRDWSGKFALLDLTCAELTGDTEQNQLRNVQSASIIITTPEKWDSVTRKWKDNARLMKMVTLFLIDEVHILKERRGATLEAVVSRMKSVGSDVRFVALSATVPNADDIASWLGKGPGAQHLPAHRDVFGEDCRPVKLEKHVWPIKGPPNHFAFDKILDASILEALGRHSKKKPTMIFCATRKMAVDTAKMLANVFASAPPSHQLWPAPKKNHRMIDLELSKIVCHGVAFHHGGVDAADRRAIEQGFLDSDISIICCTSTLAVGVNLPCYLVVIKGTVAWGDKGIQEYPDLEVMQMLGRAGRPQFETSACAVILTRPEKEQHYKKMVSGEEILESCLHLNLIEHLNSEIGLGTVSDITSAKNWLASTFMFVRLQKNPRHYQLEGQIEQNGHEDLLASICAKDVDLLQEARLVSDAPHFKCTEFGDAMARYYIKFETMKTILAMPPKAKMSEIVCSFTRLCV